MKLSLLFPLLIAAMTNCMPSLEQPATKAQEITVSQSTSGYSGGVAWHCQQEELNDKLVWVKCSFNNVSDMPAKACIDIAYLSIFDVNYVLNHKGPCSGWLAPHEKTDGYAAFFNRERIKLNYLCGPKLHKCSMISMVNSNCDKEVCQ